MMVSRITGGPVSFLFNAKVLGKYNVKYFQCQETGFIQTEEPYWLEEAYSDAITKLDIGLPYRNIHLSEIVEKLLLQFFDKDSRFLDYAGGYGLFTRLMRDKGLDFYNTDKFCKNIFAEFFDIKDIPADTQFEAITAFEVFEHLADPYKEIKEMLTYSDNLIFTTELQPEQTPENINDWWYFIPETGQHISFYTARSLSYIAKKLGYNYYTDNVNIHLFTKTTYKDDPLIQQPDSLLVKLAKKIIRKGEKMRYKKKDSLLMPDWRYIKSKLS